MQQTSKHVFACDLCAKTFDRKSNWARHVANRSCAKKSAAEREDEDVSKGFRCPFPGCDRSYKFEEGRIRHKKTCKFRPAHDDVAPQTQPSSSSSGAPKPPCPTFMDEDTAFLDKEELTDILKSTDLYSKADDLHVQIRFDTDRACNMTAYASPDRDSDLALVFDGDVNEWLPCNVSWVAHLMNLQVAEILHFHCKDHAWQFKKCDHERLRTFCLNVENPHLMEHKMQSTRLLRDRADVVLVAHPYGDDAKRVYDEFLASGAPVPEGAPLAWS